MAHTYIVQFKAPKIIGKSRKETMTKRKEQNMHLYQDFIDWLLLQSWQSEIEIIQKPGFMNFLLIRTKSKNLDLLKSGPNVSKVILDQEFPVCKN